MNKQTIEQLFETYRGGTKVRSVIEGSLKTINENDGELNVMRSMHDRTALIQEADAADERWAAIRSGTATPRLLEGVPIILKDNISVRGELTGAGSKILDGYRSPYSATVVDKLRAAGAIILGKGNMDEFAMGSSGENSGYGATKNPVDHTRVPGGSSSGSTAAVAAGWVPLAYGSDTGGSIREPASFCGVIGLKPSYGRVSRYGLLAMASSLDQIGPLTTSVADTARGFEAIAGRDPFDATSRSWSDDLVGLTQSITQLPEHLAIASFDGPATIEGIDLKIRSLITDRRTSFIDSIHGKPLTSFEAIVGEEAAANFLDLALDTYYILVPAEVSSNLARYDGIRFGIHPAADSLEDVYLNARSQGFGDEVKRRIMLGTHVLSSGYYDAYYKTALKARAYIQQEFAKVFRQVDVLMGPTAPTVAFKLGERTEDPIAMYLADLFTIPANIGGLCAISVPCGTVDGLPVGMQLIAKAGDERKLLQTAKEFESMIQEEK